MKQKNSAIVLSIIIPCFNEMHRIEFGLKNVLEYLQLQSYSWEIIIVDDASTDRTIVRAKELLAHIENKRIISLKKNRGKGGAIKAGVEHAKGSNIVFSDIDMSTPIETLGPLLTALETYDVAIGVRRHPQSRVTIHQSRIRELLGNCFTKLTNAIVAPGICDFTCGFKGFRKEPANIIFSRVRIFRWAFDAEIIFIAKKFGYSVAQVPVSWSNNEGTKVHMLRDGVEAFRDLLLIRLNDLSGKYSR